MAIDPVYFGDAYPREGCTISIDVTREGYGVSVFAPGGQRLETYANVKTPRAAARMVKEWCFGSKPRLRDRLDANAPCDQKEAAGMFPDPQSGPFCGTFVPAMFRGVTANPHLGGNEIGLSLNLRSGEVARLLISTETAEAISRALADAVGQFSRRTNSHSPSSSGMPSVEVSTQRE